MTTYHLQEHHRGCLGRIGYCIHMLITYFPEIHSLVLSLQFLHPRRNSNLFLPNLQVLPLQPRPRQKRHRSQRHSGQKGLLQRPISDGTNTLTCVSPACNKVTFCSSEISGILPMPWINVFCKTLFPTDTKIAPLRLWKNTTTAVPMGSSLMSRTACTAIRLYWIAMPDPAAVRIW